MVRGVEEVLRRGERDRHQHPGRQRSGVSTTSTPVVATTGTLGSPADVPAAAAPAAGPSNRRAGPPEGVLRLGRGSGLALGMVLLWMSILVILPLAAVLFTSASNGFGAFVDTVTSPAVAASIRLTVMMAAAATVVNTVFGTLVAWVLVRDRFVGRQLLSLVIDVPFALPTIVAGLVLIALYGTNSPLGITLAQTRWSIFIALLFVTLPFVVRAVQPVLEELDLDVEEAGASLGASKFTIFVPVVNGSGWRWPGRWPPNRTCCCSTSPSVPWTRKFARSYVTGCAGSTTRCTSQRSS